MHESALKNRLFWINIAIHKKEKQKIRNLMKHIFQLQDLLQNRYQCVHVTFGDFIKLVYNYQGIPKYL